MAKADQNAAERGGDGDAAETPALRITAKVDGFRRCGVAHPATPMVHEAGAFTADQVERLKAEPSLVVEELG